MFANTKYQLCYVIAALLWANNPAIAAETPLYQQRVEQAAPDDKALQHSEELLRDHKDVKVQEKLVIQPFHKQSGELETAPEAFCRDCHSPLPHDKSVRTRAFNNMHVRFIACETCHFRPQDVQLSYQWFDYNQQTVVDGKGLFRLTHPMDNSQQRPNNPKIAPFYQQQPAMALKSSAFSKSIAEQWDKADAAAKIALRAKIHWPLEDKGLLCQDCHAEQNGKLDLNALGATDEEATAMVKHVIPQFFKRYEKDDQRITILDMLR